MAAVADRKDPYSVFNFLVEIDGIIEGGFTEVSGLSVQVDFDTIKEGGVNDYEHKLPKGVKYSDITLKRGLIDLDLYLWCQNVAYGEIERKNGTVHLLDLSGNPVKSWYFFEAYPVKWEGPSLNASSNAIASETLVLTHHGLV